MNIFLLSHWVETAMDVGSLIFSQSTSVYGALGLPPFFGLFYKA